MYEYHFFKHYNIFQRVRYKRDRAELRRIISTARNDYSDVNFRIIDCSENTLIVHLESERDISDLGFTSELEVTLGKGVRVGRLEEPEEFPSEKYSRETMPSRGRTTAVGIKRPGLKK